MLAKSRIFLVIFVKFFCATVVSQTADAMRSGSVELVFEARLLTALQRCVCVGCLSQLAVTKELESGDVEVRTCCFAKTNWDYYYSPSIN